MKLKRIASYFLAVLLCVLAIDLEMLQSYAEEVNEREMVYISAVINGNAQRLPAIQNEDGILFLSGETLSEITVYQNEKNEMFFQHDNATDSVKYREIIINKELKVANVIIYAFDYTNIAKAVDLPDIINYNDEWYFPLAEMLPLLNANAVVEDDCLYVEDVKYSMSNIMPEFKIEDYMYNSYNENDLGFTSSEKVLSAYSYLYNTVLNFDLKRLTFTGRYLGKVDSYEEILTSYLAEDETYYEALKDEDDYALPLIDYLQSDDSERISTLIDAMAPAKELADSYYENSKMTFSDYESITSMAKIAEISDFAIDMYSIAAIYTDHVDDHYQMLKSVYAIGDTEKVSFLQSLTDPSNVAANRVYATYSEDKVNMIAGIVCQQTEKALTGELQDIVLQQVAEKKGLGNGFLWSQLATCVAKEYFIATDFYVHKVASECENLGYYNRLMEQGYGQYSKYSTGRDLISHENIENMRLSAIFTLLASRSIYQALCEADKAIGNSGDIYQRKVDSINEVLKKLYLAKNCCLTDSEEYIDEKIKELKQSMADVSIVDTLNSIVSFEEYKAYFLDNYSMQDKVCLVDVTHDGADEMIVITEINEGVKLYQGTVYSIIDGNVAKIYEKSGGADHASGFFNWYLTCNDGVWNLAEEYFGMWQGRGETGFKECYLSSNGDITEKKLIYTPQSADDIDSNGVISDKAFDDYVNQLTAIINSSYRIFYCHSEAGEAEPQRIETNPGNVFGIEKNKQVSIEEISSLSAVQLNIPAIIIANGGLNLRSGPSENDNVITLIPKKTTLNLISVVDNYQDYLNGYWVYVDYNGQKGYVNSAYLSFENKYDMSNLSSEQIFVLGMILYHRYLSDTHVLSLPSVLKQNYDIEVLGDDIYEHNNTWYRKILPQGLLISEIESAYREEFSNKYHTPSFSQYLIEYDGYVWEPFGFGGDVEFDYAELVKLNNITEAEIEYTVLEHRRNEYGTQIEVEVEFSIVKEDGIWKCGKITEHA